MEMPSESGSVFVLTTSGGVHPVWFENPTKEMWFGGEPVDLQKAKAWLPCPLPAQDAFQNNQ